MAVGHQDHGRIAMPVAAMLSGAVHQPLDLALGEVAPLDCQVYDAWGAFLGCRFHADKLCLRVSYCICYTYFLNSQSIPTSLGIAAHATIWNPSNGVGCGLDPASLANRRTRACAASSSVTIEIIQMPARPPEGATHRERAWVKEDDRGVGSTLP